MPVRKFAGEDALEPFREWVAHKPRGYVLNTDSGRSSPASAAAPADYIKVCSPEPKELDEWAVAHLGYGLRNQRCQHCDPSSLGLTY